MIGGSFQVNSTRASRVTTFDLADFFTKYSMAFREVISKILTLYSHWLLRYWQFSAVAIGCFLTRVRNRVKNCRLQHLISPPNKLLHQPKCYHTVNCTQICQKCSQIMGMYYGFEDIGQRKCSKFS